MDVDACVKTIKAYRDSIVGVKVRLARMVCDNGKNEIEVYRFVTINLNQFLGIDLQPFLKFSNSIQTYLSYNH